MLERSPVAWTESSPRHVLSCDLGGLVPYIHVTLALGRPTEVKRQLIGGLTDTMEDVLEVARSDIHVLLWEIPTENIGEAGLEPASDVTNNVMVLMSQGRPSEVVLVLIKSLTDVVEAVLGVARKDVHLVVLEEPFTRIGEAGIPMEPPRVPHWYYHDTVGRHDR
jgi:4-oxalocrotonate tautomerase family enzyme